MTDGWGLRFRIEAFDPEQEQVEPWNTACKGLVVMQAVIFPQLALARLHPHDPRVVPGRAHAHPPTQRQAVAELAWPKQQVSCGGAVWFHAGHDILQVRVAQGPGPPPGCGPPLDHGDEAAGAWPTPKSSSSPDGLIAEVAEGISAWSLPPVSWCTSPVQCRWMPCRGRGRWCGQGFQPQGGQRPLEGTPTVIEASDASAFAWPKPGPGLAGDVAARAPTRLPTSPRSWPTITPTTCWRKVTKPAQNPVAQPRLGLTQGGLNEMLGSDKLAPPSAATKPPSNAHRALLSQDSRRLRRACGTIAKHAALQNKTVLHQLFAFDYDGVFTNGTVYLCRRQHGTNRSARDGYVKQGLELAVIAGGKEEPCAGAWRTGSRDLSASDKLAQVALLSAKTFAGELPTWRRPQRPERPASRAQRLSLRVAEVATWWIGWFPKGADKMRRNMIEQP